MGCIRFGMRPHAEQSQPEQQTPHSKDGERQVGNYIPKIGDAQKAPLVSEIVVCLGLRNPGNKRSTTITATVTATSAVKPVLREINSPSFPVDSAATGRCPTDCECPAKHSGVSAYRGRRAATASPQSVPSVNRYGVTVSDSTIRSST